MIKLPVGWEQTLSPIPFQQCYTKYTGLVVFSGETDFEGDLWLHVSCSHRNKIPSWKELKEVKNIFVGPGRKAIQIFPKEGQYVNFCKTCLHLWCNLSRDIVPDFEKVTGTI